MAAPNTPIRRVARFDGAVAGFAFPEPGAVSHGSWNLRAIATARNLRRRGPARPLLSDVEASLRAAGARRLVVDTSDAQALASARALHRRAGYGDGGTLSDFWAPGEAKVTVFKRL
ncbi:MAG: GNAT family N-acetyltransferase [Pseudomonadota bacterium]